MSTKNRVCVEDHNGQLRKIALIASNRSGFYVSVPYHKSRKGFFWRSRPPDRPGVGLERIMPHQSYCASSRVKLSFHPPNEAFDTFLIQISGDGIVSGIDPITGKPKGLCLIGGPLDEITTGPTFGITAHGLHDFDPPRPRDRNCLVIPRADMMLHCEESDCGYNLEFFLYRNAVRRSHRKAAKWYREYYYHGEKRGFYLPVIELPEIDRFLGVFCRTIPLIQQGGSGYIMSTARQLGWNLVAMYPAGDWPARSLDHAGAGEAYGGVQS